MFRFGYTTSSKPQFVSHLKPTVHLATITSLDTLFDRLRNRLTTQTGYCAVCNQHFSATRRATDFPIRDSWLFNLAESLRLARTQGFEPWDAFTSTVFKTAAISRSAMSAYVGLISRSNRKARGCFVVIGVTYPFDNLRPKRFGATDRSRTYNLLITNQLLCH